MTKIILILLLIVSVDSFASGIASNSASAPCTNNTLETYSGNSNLSADWQPNEIQLRWYNNNTLMNVQNSANTCTYDSTLTIPQTAPTRTGYTFAGWTVRPEIDFATTIPLNVNGTERWAIGWDNNTNANYCWYGAADASNTSNVDCNSDQTYNEIQTYEWKVHFEHGDLYGMAGCSATDDGTYGQTGTPTIGTGRYCWCKATGYKATNASMVSGSLYTLSWVFAYDNEFPHSCAKYCASACTYGPRGGAGYRSALFTPTSN